MAVLASEIKTYTSAVAVDFDPDSNGGEPGAEVASGVVNNVLPDVQDYNIWGEFGDGASDWAKTDVGSRWRKLFLLPQNSAGDEIAKAFVHLTAPTGLDDVHFLHAGTIAQLGGPRTGSLELCSGVASGGAPRTTLLALGRLKSDVAAGASSFVVVYDCGYNPFSASETQIVWIGTSSTSGEYFEGATVVYDSETNEATITIAGEETLVNAYTAGACIANCLSCEVKPSWWHKYTASSSQIYGVNLVNANTILDRFTFAFSNGGAFTCTSDKRGAVGSGVVTSPFTAYADGQELFTLPIPDQGSTCIMYDYPATPEIVLWTLPAGIVVWVEHAFNTVLTDSAYGAGTLKLRMRWLNDAEEQRYDFEAPYTLGVLDSPVLAASASECSVFGSEIQSDVAAENGGGLGAELSTGLGGVVLPDVSGVEQHEGVTRWRKLFFYAGGREGRARLRLAGPTAGDDRVVVQHNVLYSNEGQSGIEGKRYWFPNTQEMQSSCDAGWQTLLPLCCGRIKENVAAGATSFVFVVDGETEQKKVYNEESEEILVPAYDQKVMPIWIGAGPTAEHLGYCLCTQTGNEVTVTLLGGRTLANSYTTSESNYAGNCRIVTFAAMYSVSSEDMDSGYYHLSKYDVSGNSIIHETWTLQFTSLTEFTCSGSKIGGLVNGLVSADYAPINPATGMPYFIIPADSWGDFTIGYNPIGKPVVLVTVPSHFPVWLKQTVPVDTEHVEDNGVTLVLDWDDGV
jgi:hypothetical protein